MKLLAHNRLFAVQRAKSEFFVVGLNHKDSDTDDVSFVVLFSPFRIKIEAKMNFLVLFQLRTC